MKGKVPVVILEGVWWSVREVPLVLPYFEALARTFPDIDLSHRTFRSVEDVEYYVSKLPKNGGAMLYFACHGSNLHLAPTDDSLISPPELVDALGKAKDGAISFIHFGCCEMVDPQKRRESHEKYLNACGAKWASGYTKEVEWLKSTLLDLAFVAEVFVPYRKGEGYLKKKADWFFINYEQLARELCFSALSKVSEGPKLFPERLRQND